MCVNKLVFVYPFPFSNRLKWPRIEMNIIGCLVKEVTLLA